MSIVTESRFIRDVYQVELKLHADDRGSFLETFRREWFPRSWDVLQANCSRSEKNVLRGLHYHHRQIDYWFVPAGRIRVGLFDLREGSPTRGGREVLEMDESSPRGLYIPVGVAHGFLSLTPSTLMYLVDATYDASDEFGIAWDDPDAGIAWGISTPVLSTRDQSNPRLRDIPPEDRPRL